MRLKEQDADDRGCGADDADADDGDDDGHALLLHI